MSNPQSYESFRRRVGSIIDIGTADDFPSRAYDIVYTLVLLVNLFVTIAYTFDDMEARCGGRAAAAWRRLTVAYFTVDYCPANLDGSGIITPADQEWRSICKYALSFSGIIDLLSFLPYYLPDLLSRRRRGLPDVPGGADLPALPHQRLL